MFYINIKEALQSIEAHKNKLTKDQLSRALALSMNETVALQRTQSRQFVRKTFNMPAPEIKSIDLKRANKNNLIAELGASGKPVSLTYFKPKFATKTFSATTLYSAKDKSLEKKVGKGKKQPNLGVSIEIYKGQRKSLPFAFMTKDSRKPVFARGQYGAAPSYGLTLRDKRVNKKGSDLPIANLISLSPSGAAFSQKTMTTIPVDMTKEFEKKLLRIVGAMIEGKVPSAGGG